MVQKKDKKEEVKKEEKAETKVLFYANAVKLAKAKKVGKTREQVKAAYENLGGAFTEGFGIEEV